PVVDCEAYWRAGAREVRVFRGHHDPVWAVAYHPDGTIAASGSVDHTIRIWEVDTGRMLRILRGHSDTVRCLAFSPDGQMLASGSELCALDGHKSDPFDGTIERRGFWVESQEGWETAFENWVGGLAFSPDGTVLVSGSRDKTMKYWEVPSGTLIRTVRAHAGWVRAVTYSPAGKIIASCSDDTTIKLWDIKTGRPIRTLKGHKEPVRSIAFSPDGRRLLSG